MAWTALYIIAGPPAIHESIYRAVTGSAGALDLIGLASATAYFPLMYALCCEGVPEYARRGG
jgi:hypothetical protein